MKKIGNITVAALVCAGALAFAGQVYDRVTVALGTTTGTATWTNTSDYAAIELKRLVMVANTDAGATVTVTRVTSDNTYTQSVCTLVALNATNVSTLASQYLAYGDKLRFASSTATGATAMVEFEVQKH